MCHERLITSFDGDGEDGRGLVSDLLGEGDDGLVGAAWLTVCNEDDEFGHVAAALQGAVGDLKAEEDGGSAFEIVHVEG